MWGLVTGAVALLGGVALVLSGSWPAGERESGRGDGPRGPGELSLYNAGERVDGLSLVAVLNRVDSAGYVSFVYGDCAAGDDAGCASPAEIQVWPACRRNLALYEQAQAGGVVSERLTLRGVPAASFDGGTQLELQTGVSTVVVFADSWLRASRVAAALASVDGSVRAGRPLPAPAPGAVEGAIDC
jgi:hypothetical protein